MIKITVRPCLNKLLDKKNMTQQQLSDKIGIPQASISRFDRTTQRRDTHLFLIAYGLGVKIEDLFEVTIEKKEEPKE